MTCGVFVFYNNLVTWSHVTTCDYLVTGSHMESQESQVVTLVTVEVNNDNMALMVMTALCNMVTVTSFYLCQYRNKFANQNMFD